MPKRKAPANPSPPRTAPAVPPALPPSVEEAYRRKCMELKQRTKEVEDVNDATQLRLARLKRQVEKLRVERAFLYEQLAKRTSTNVEDSEGSPSPPPTPKEKPLRIKRGHRKPSILQSFEANPVAGSTFINQNLATLSPSSDTFSHPLDHKDGHSKDSPSARLHAGAAATNGISAKSPKKPRSAFELYADKMRAEIRSKLEKQDEQDEEGTPAAPANVEEELEQAWKDLPGAEKEDFRNRERDEMEKYQEAKEKFDAEQDKKEEQASAAVASPKSGVGKADEDPKSSSGDKDVKDEPDNEQDAEANAKSSGARESSKHASQDEDVEMNEDSD